MCYAENGKNFKAWRGFMQLIYAYDSMTKNGHKNDYSFDLCINNCGHFLGVSTCLYTEREIGFEDFQLIYVESGLLTCSLNSREYRVRAGELLLYTPRARQEYTYHPAPNSSYYWLHFGGRELQQRFACLKQTAVLRPNYTGFLSPIFEKLILEICSRGANSFFYTEALGLELLYRLEQALQENRKTAYSAMICGVIQQMKAKGENFSVSQYAAQCQMNPDYFIRVFKKETGYTPNQYRLNILTDRAKKLLLKTELSVSQIAEQLGFADPLYFSHAFKKRVGVSPVGYRKQK